MSSPNKKKDEKKPGTGSVQPPLDGALAAWIERMFRGGETIQSIDVFPLLRGRDRELRSLHHDIKNGEKVGPERAIEIANEIYSDCQLHCDALGKKNKIYEVTAIDERRGGLAAPVGTHLMTLNPRAHRPAPKEGENEDGEPEGEALTARKLMLESVKLVHEKDRFQQENEGKIVGDIMLLMKSSLTERERMILEVLKDNKELIGEFRTLMKEIAERKVEERAVGIDEANAAEDRRDRASARQKDNMWSNVTEAAMLEAVKQVGQIFPGIGAMFIAHMTGKTPPDPPQLSDGKIVQQAAPSGAPQLPPPEEQVIIKRFIAAAESHKVGDKTAAEKLFGEDDDSGNAITPGVFSREQVTILSGVDAGTIGVEALDALLTDSGKPEAVTGMQMVKAMAFMTPAMITDVTRFMVLRKEARAVKS